MVGDLEDLKAWLQSSLDKVSTVANQTDRQREECNVRIKALQRLVGDKLKFEAHLNKIMAGRKV